MSLEKILEYQTIDQRIFREEVSLRKSPEAQEASNMNAQLVNAQQTLFKMDKESQELFTEVEKIEGQIASFTDKEKGVFNINSVKDLQEAEAVERALNAFSEELSNLEREYKKMFRRLQEIRADAQKLYEAGVVSKRKLDTAKASYGEKMAKVKENLKADFEALSALKKDISPELFAAYKNLRDHRKMPAFVLYDNGNCSACGMQIQAEVEKKLNNSGDTAECPNCRRIVYIK